MREMMAALQSDLETARQELRKARGELDRERREAVPQVSPLR